MASKSLKIDKTLRPITLWVHPEGRVTGSIFVQPEIGNNSGDKPADVLKMDASFPILQKQEPAETCFYKRSAINGMILESLPSEYSRWYAYLKQTADRFIKLLSNYATTYLINKSYVTQILSENG